LTLLKTRRGLQNKLIRQAIPRNAAGSDSKPVVKKEDIETDSLDADAQAIEKGKEVKELKPEQKEMLNKMNDAQIKFNTNMKENQTSNYLKPDAANNTDGFISRMVKTFGGKKVDA